MQYFVIPGVETYRILDLGAAGDFLNDVSAVFAVSASQNDRNMNKCQASQPQKNLEKNSPGCTKPCVYHAKTRPAWGGSPKLRSQDQGRSRSQDHDRSIAAIARSGELSRGLAPTLYPKWPPCILPRPPRWAPRSLPGECGGHPAKGKWAAACDSYVLGCTQQIYPGVTQTECYLWP